MFRKFAGSWLLVILSLSSNVHAMYECQLSILNYERGVGNQNVVWSQMIYAAQSAGTQGTLATVLEKRTPHSDVRIKVVGTIQGGGAEPDGTARNPTLQVKLQKDIHFFDRDEKNSITDIAMGYGGIGNFTLISPFTYPKVDYIFRARCNILPEEVLSDPLWKEIVLSRKRDLPFDWTRIKEKNGKVERLWRDLK